MAITYARFYAGTPTVIDYTPGSAVSAGDVIVLSNNVWFAREDIAANTLGALCADAIFDLPKEAGVAHDQGVLVYWDATNKVVTTTAASNKKIGIVAAAAAAADTRGKYRSILQAV